MVQEVPQHKALQNFLVFLHIFHKSDYFNACNFGLYLVIYIVPWWFTISHLFSWFLWWDQVIGKLSIFAKYEYLKREVFGKFSHFCIFFLVETWFINFTKDCVLITKSHFENAPPPWIILLRINQKDSLHMRIWCSNKDYRPDSYRLCILTLRLEIMRISLSLIPKQ